MNQASSFKDIKNFFKKLLILLLPFILCIPFVIYLILTKELYFNGVNMLADCHMGTKPCLIGLMYSSPECPQLKIEMTKRLRPKILAIGTSRIMQVRRNFFRSESSFYNAGGAIRRLPHIQRFLDKLPPDYHPNILLISLDQRFFNPNWEHPVDTKDYDNFFEMDYSDPLYVLGQILKGFPADVMANKISWKDYFQVSPQPQLRIGLSAHLENSGFRNDGSYVYGNILKNPEDPSLIDYQFRFTHDLITKRTRGFQFSKDISPMALQELDALLERAAQNNIHVIALIPPYAHEVYQRMMNLGDGYGYMKELYIKLRPFFIKYRSTLFDASDLAKLGASDKEALDGFHGSEKPT